MKAAIVKGNSKIEIEDFDISDLKPNELLIKMQSCGICGSDVEKVFGKYGQPSMRLGHEPAGEVIKIGSNISDFKIGDRVFTHHHVACYSKDCHECSHGNETMCKKYYESNLNPCGLADNYVVPEWNVIHGGVLKLPEHVSYEEAALIEPFACCVRAWSKFKYQKAGVMLSQLVNNSKSVDLLERPQFNIQSDLLSSFMQDNKKDQSIIFFNSVSL